MQACRFINPKTLNTISSWSFPINDFPTLLRNYLLSKSEALLLLIGIFFLQLFQTLCISIMFFISTLYSTPKTLDFDLNFDHLNFIMIMIMIEIMIMIMIIIIITIIIILCDVYYVFNPRYFLKGPNKTFQMNLISCPNWDWFFAVSSRKYIKWAIFDILMTITLGVNITRQMSPFFSSLLWALSVGIFHFYISKICKTY